MKKLSTSLLVLTILVIPGYTQQLSELFNQVKRFPNVMTGSLHTHMRAGEVQLQHIGAIIFGNHGQILPLCIGKTHTAGDQNPVWIFLFQIKKVNQVVFQGTV